MFLISISVQYGRLNRSIKEFLTVRLASPDFRTVEHNQYVGRSLKVNGSFCRRCLQQQQADSRNKKTTSRWLLVRAVLNGAKAGLKSIINALKNIELLKDN